MMCELVGDFISRFLKGIKYSCPVGLLFSRALFDGDFIVVVVVKSRGLSSSSSPSVHSSSESISLSTF